MLNPRQILMKTPINSIYDKIIADVLRPVRLFTTVDILVVVDTEIATEPGVGFGIGSVIELIRGARVGCMRFRVDIARRSGGNPAVVASPAAFGPKYTGFRFDMKNGGANVIDSYEQIWCFGFKPDNNGGPDSNIDQPGAFPATNAELAALARWMKEKKGGLFATGDHDYLGASMCRKIPRVGTMRRWTNADGVPPIGSPSRIDTLRPPSSAYQPGNPGGPLPLDNGAHQGDTTPQRIEWVPWSKIKVSFLSQRVRPHPVLCHPTLGPIDVMPDHAHEGLCRDTGTVPLGGTYNFDGAGPQPEYPDAIDGGPKPEPVVIAYGSTLGSPPYNFTKGSQPARSHFPMISVYDGHRAGVGRVATDSTWHHWFDVNIDDIKAENGDNWAKISRYFINLATWLAPPGFTTTCLYYSVLTSHFDWVGFQEYSPRLTDIELGRAFRYHFARYWGPCWITQIFWDLIRDLDIKWIEEPRIPIPDDPCLTCPPIDFIEDVVLGGLVRAGFEPAERIRRIAEGDERAERFEIKSLQHLLGAGVPPALNRFAELWRKDLEHSAARVARFAGAGEAAAR